MEKDNTNVDITTMDFVDKKEKFADLIEAYIEDSDKEKELLDYIATLKDDFDFRDKDLFQTFFDELTKFLPDLTRRELKQRVLMIRSFIEWF